jgi:predicted Na+-dependent transporter
LPLPLKARLFFAALVNPLSALPLCCFSQIQLMSLSAFISGALVSTKITSKWVKQAKNLLEETKA